MGLRRRFGLDTCTDVCFSLIAIERIAGESLIPGEQSPCHARSGGAVSDTGWASVIESWVLEASLNFVKRSQ